MESETYSSEQCRMHLLLLGIDIRNLVKLHIDIYV